MATGRPGLSNVCSPARLNTVSFTPTMPSVLMPDGIANRTDSGGPGADKAYRERTLRPHPARPDTDDGAYCRAGLPYSPRQRQAGTARVSMYVMLFV